MQFGPIFLLLALLMSWPRFIIIFLSGTEGSTAQSPITLVASAVSITSLGLAIADQGPVTGSLLVIAAILVSRMLPTERLSIPVIASGASLCVYLQLTERVG